VEKVVYRTCTLCEACCGIEVSVDGDRVVAIRGDDLDPLSRGYVCAKARALADLHQDPDRLRHPLRRTSRGWERLSWKEAFAYAAQGLVRAQREHGDEALAFYSGEPVTHNLGAVLFGEDLFGALETRKRFSANTLDQMPKQLASHWMYGSGLFLSVPDLDRTDYLLMLGANPVISNGSLMTAPGMPRRLRDLRARGGRLVVIDPRRTETAALADAHHFIRPGTDALLLASLLHVLFAEGRVRTDRVLPFVQGVERLRKALQGFAPEKTAGRVGIAAETMRSLARDFSDAPTAVCYGRMGTSTVSFGTTVSWLIEVLNIVTGNLDRPGGAMFPKPAIDLLRLQPPTRRGRWRSRTRGTPEFMGELPAATLAEEIETPGPGQVRALLTLAGNPVLSSPGGNRVGDALRRLDFMVSIDFYRNETTQHADVILPPAGPLERDHFDVVFQLFFVRTTARWSPAVFRRPADARTDAEILLALSSRLRWERGGLHRAGAAARRVLLGLGADRAARLAVALLLRAGPYGSGLRPWRDGVTLRRLREARHGLDLGPLEPCLPERLPAKSGRIDLVPEEALADLSRLLASLYAEVPGLLLIGRREARTVNSWSHNLPSLIKAADRCVLQIHPSDAAKLGIEDGSTVRLRSRAGALEVPVRLTDALMPGVVSLPHGYGHRGEGIALKIASDHAGVSCNDLTDPAEIDPLSGNAVLSGVPVRVEAL
jgi:anaerobic selenocysteine-containing dehydrogenase